MPVHDDELTELRARVDCRTVLEQAGWELDGRESSRRAAKYRNGAGRIVIVTHEGKGWFDPLSDGRGDVIALARHVWGLTLGHARKALRPLAGIAPRLVSPVQAPADAASSDDPSVRWRSASVPQPGSAAWQYLTEVRSIPRSGLARAVQAGVLREGIQGTAWAMHQAADARITGWEMRGPSYKGFSRGGTKSVFWIGQPAASDRLAVTESAVDALSLASLEDWPAGTVYASVGGGFGPQTTEALQALLQPQGILVAATDLGAAGDALAARLHRLAEQCGNRSERMRPDLKDWNEQLVSTSRA